ncbi:hypothetical protein FF011L_49220 [Roseimaritima multifibrata]|uniref:Uncharacterized protein n=1 Tax=Roseimaritima multifibrata TaxID=1930274 RepID=A0A517MMK1_9BACT|nr:hypothetical protein FF011L_49220 [Roseimaritima multifibrata]
MPHRLTPVAPPLRGGDLSKHESRRDSTTGCSTAPNDNAWNHERTSATAAYGSWGRIIMQELHEADLIPRLEGLFISRSTTRQMLDLQRTNSLGSSHLRIKLLLIQPRTHQRKAIRNRTRVRLQQTNIRRHSRSCRLINPLSRSLLSLRRRCHRLEFHRYTYWLRLIPTTHSNRVERTSCSALCLDVHCAYSFSWLV